MVLEIVNLVLLFVDDVLLLRDLIFVPVVFLLVNEKLELTSLLDGNGRFFEPLLVGLEVYVTVDCRVKLHSFFDEVFVWHLLLLTEDVLQDLLVKLGVLLLLMVDKLLNFGLLLLVVCFLYIVDNFVLLLKINVKEINRCNSCLIWLVNRNLIVKYFQTFQRFDEVFSLFLLGHF